MTKDRTLRANPPRLVDQLRRDELPAYTEAREGRCPECGGSGAVEADFFAGLFDECPTCDSTEPTGLVPCYPLDVAALLVLTEEAEVAEEVMSCLDVKRESQVKFSPHMSGKVPLSPWLSRVAQFAAKLPPKRVEVPCEECDSTGEWEAQGDPVGPWDDWPEVEIVPCGACHGTGRVAHDTPAQRWLIVVAAEAVARECVHDCPCDFRGGHCTCGLRQIVEALDACRAWIAEPTPEREEAWGSAWGARTAAAGLPAWVPMPLRDSPRVLLAAADVIGPDRVREIASCSIREAVRYG